MSQGPGHSRMLDVTRVAPPCDDDATPPLGVPVVQSAPPPPDDGAKQVDPSGSASFGSPESESQSPGTPPSVTAVHPPRPALRFAAAYGAGAGAGTLVFVGMLGAGAFRPFRTALATGLFSNFYDLQARALLDGRLDLPVGALSIEGFRLRDQEFMYFPPWPAVLRMPVLAVTERFDGRLTALSMLLAYVVFMAAAGLLAWNVRAILAPARPLTGLGALGAVVFALVLGGGSTVTFLGALPWVYHEAYLWSLAGTVGTAAMVTAVVRRPTAGRIAAVAALATVTVLSRTTSGWAVSAAVIAVGTLLAVRPRPTSSRADGIWMAIGGAAALTIGVAVNWAKFRHPYMFPLDRQVWTGVNAWRRSALAANDGSLTNVGFLPTTLRAYLRPDGLDVSTVFPWIHLPPAPPGVIGDVVVDQRYRTGSIVAFMPLLVGLAASGTVAVVRTRVRDRWPLRIVAAASVAVAGPILVYGYVAHRYTAEFIGGLAVLGAAGLPSLDGLTRPARIRLAAVALSLGAAFGVLATVAISWQAIALSARGDELADLVARRIDWSGAFGDDPPPLRVTGRLPAPQPADRLVVVGDCRAVFIATGDLYEPWIPVSLRDLSVAVTVTEDTEPYELRLVDLDGARDRGIALQHDGRGNYRIAIVGNFVEDWSDWYAVAAGSTIDIHVVGDTARGEYVVDVPGWTYAVVPVADWDDDWISVPNQLVVGADRRTPGVAIAATWGPPPASCARWEDQ